MPLRRSLSRPAVAIMALGLSAGALSVQPAIATPVGTTTPGATSAATTAPPAVRVTNGCLRSVPEPGTTAPVDICYTLFRPARATTSKRVPMIMHSHGWGGSRITDPTELSNFTRAGYGVISFDQRGWGESGGKAHVEDPAFEGKDVRRLIRLVSRLKWVKQDRKGDPRLGAIGGSYGGGYQFVGAFEELRIKGRPVFDALAPQITWHDLSQSLAPSGVVRTEWAAALSAAAVPSNALETSVYQALIEGAVTGNWPDGSGLSGADIAGYFADNGPKFHTDRGRRLDIPVLFGQGTTDTLFPLEQGLSNWRRTITKRARKQSIFVGYNGGHVLPSVLPAGVMVTSDPCSTKLGGADFERLSITFFNHALKNRKRKLRGYGKIHLATPDSTCTTIRNPGANTTVPVGQILTSTTIGPPVPYKVADGPIRIAGTPSLTGSLTAVGLNNRAFYGLAVGSSPTDAHLIQNNVLPVNEVTPVRGAARRIALPSVAVDVPAGESLYLIASATSDTFVAMGSRTGGGIVIDNARVHLPVVGR